MEAHIGLELDIIRFPDDTKKKILEMRNDKIKQGQDGWTCTDVLVYSVNMAHTVHTQEKKLRATNAMKQQIMKPEGSVPTITPVKPTLQNTDNQE